MLTVPTVRPQDELLSVPQAAHLLGVAAMTARLYVLTGKLPGRPADNGRLLIRRADLDTFLAQRPPRTAPATE